MGTRSKVFGGSKPLRKEIGAAIWQSGHQKISNFSACQAQDNQHEIRIAFFEREKFIPVGRILENKQLYYLSDSGI